MENDMENGSISQLLGVSVPNSQGQPFWESRTADYRAFRTVNPKP